MTTSVPLDGLATWLRAELEDARAGDVAVLAGHYAIFTAGATAVDLLDDDTVPAAAVEMVAFTKRTWTAACDAIAGPESPVARLLVLVDDIQFVRPALSDIAARERLGAALAENYLRGMRALPAWHAGVVRDRGIGAERVLRRDADRVVFSERELRARAVRHVRQRLHTADAARAGLTANDDESRITVAHPDHGDYCLVHSGHTSCAGGYIELLATVHRAGIRTLISMIPMRCLGPVTLGTALAPRLFGIDGLTVINVAIPDVASGEPAAISRT